MSVLIRGMELPKNCWNCEWLAVTMHEGNKCELLGGRQVSEKAAYAERLADCPMIELKPHGRLIDGDVAEVITYTDEDGTFADGILYAADWIADQPTIIEAEGEDV